MTSTDYYWTVYAILAYSTRPRTIAPFCWLWTHGFGLPLSPAIISLSLPSIHSNPFETSWIFTTPFQTVFSAIGPCGQWPDRHLKNLLPISVCKDETLKGDGQQVRVIILWLKLQKIIRVPRCFLPSTLCQDLKRLLIISTCKLQQHRQNPGKQDTGQRKWGSLRHCASSLALCEDQVNSWWWRGSWLWHVSVLSHCSQFIESWLWRSRRPWLWQTWPSCWLLWPPVPAPRQTTTLGLWYLRGMGKWVVEKCACTWCCRQWHQRHNFLQRSMPSWM